MNRFARIFIFLAVAIGFIWLMFIFIGSGNKGAKPNTPKPVALTDYADTDSRVVLTIDGRVNADNAHRSVRISVGRGNRTSEVIQGYQNNVIKTQSEDNNPNAYDEFIHALAKTGFGRERTTTLTDVRGVCSDGQRYIYEIYDASGLVSRTWSASCTKGTSLANSGQVLGLFKAQITDYSKFSNDVAL